MNITEFLTIMAPVAFVVILNISHVIFGYLENTKELEAEMAHITTNTQEDSSEVDVLGFVYERTKEQLDRERRALSFDGVTVHPLNEYSPDLMVVSQTRSITDYIKPKTDYICNYCGTRYVSDENGFIPNCKNCGARLDKEK